MKYKIITQIPFCGFYESIASHEIDREIEMLFDLEGTGEATIPDGFWMACDFEAIHEAYAKEYVRAFNDWFQGETGIDLQLSFESLQSPKAYNFETDRIFCFIPVAKLKKLREMVNESDLQETIEEMFTSRSGFISHYSNDLDEWPEDVTEWDHNEVMTLLLAMAGEPDHMEVMEDAGGNGEISNAVCCNMGEIAEAMIPSVA